MKKLLLLLALFCASGLSFAQLSNSGPITASASSCVATNAACVFQTLYNSPAVSTSFLTVTLSGTFTATLQFEATNGAVPDPGTDAWSSVSCTPIAGGTGVTSATAAGAWSCSIGGLTQFRVRASAFTSGPVQALIQATPASASVAGAILGGPLVGNANGQGIGSEAFIDTSVLSQTTADRGSVTHGAWTNGFTANSVHGLVVDMRGETKYGDSRSRITFTTNPFPVTSTYGGSDTNYGPDFLLPPGIMFTSVPFQYGSDQGSVLCYSPGGVQSSIGQGCIVAPSSSSFAFGSGASFNPSVFPFGMNAGNSFGLVAGNGPYADHISGLTLDADTLNTNGTVTNVPGLIPFTWCSGQDLDIVDYMQFQDSNTANAIIGCGNSYLAGSGWLKDFFSKTADTSVCFSSSVSVSSWQSFNSNNANYVAVVTPTATPSPAIHAGMLAQITGTATGSHYNVNRATCLSTACEWVQICAVPDPGNLAVDAVDGRCYKASTYFTSANQFAYLINQSQIDSSATAQGTVAYRSQGVDWDSVVNGAASIQAGGGGKEIGPGSLSSNNCLQSSLPVKAVQFNYNGAANTIHDVHTEVANIGDQLGADGPVAAVPMLNMNASSSVDVSHFIDNYWGAPIDVSCIECVGSATNSAGNVAANISLADVQNGNGFSNTNNRTFTYFIGHSGTKGDVLAFANPNGGTDVTALSGWFEYAGNLDFYLAGSKFFGFDQNATGTAPLCTGCRYLKRVTSTISVGTVTPTTILAFGGLPAGNYRLECEGDYDTPTTAAGLQLEITSTGTVTNLLTNAYIWTGQGTTAASPNVYVISAASTFTSASQPNIGGTGAANATAFQLRGTISTSTTGTVTVLYEPNAAQTMNVLTGTSCVLDPSLT